MGFPKFSLFVLALSGVSCSASPNSPRSSAQPESPAREPVSAHSAGKASGPAPESATKASAAPVDPFGEGYPAPLPESGEFGRVASKTWGSWIHPRPDSRTLPLGGIRVGDSIAATGPAFSSGLGKCQQYVPVEGGFACADRRNTTDMSDPFVQANRWTEPAAGAFPYEYAFSLGAPMLTRIPTDKENRWDTGPRDYKKLRGWSVGHDELAEKEPIEPNGPIPDFLKDGGYAPNAWGKKPGLLFKKVPFGSMIAYTRAFEANGQVWVLSTNLTVVPAKGLLRFRRTKFHGLELNSERNLPIAWARKTARSKYRLEGDQLVQTSEVWAARTWMQLTGESRKQAGKRYLETKDGFYIAEDEASVAERRKTPWEVTHDFSPQNKWVHIRVNSGTLTLYEGDKAVFTTLMSPGKEGATPYGRYWIESKEQVSTMTTEMGEPRKFWIADVPWTQYFERPYAIHAAYWHEDFGERKSGGCVNLSPIDAKRVFDWTVPAFNEKWGMVQGRGMGHSTFILVEG